MRSRSDRAVVPRLLRARQIPPGKKIILGVPNLGTNDVETPEILFAERIRRALPYISAERLVIAPDCGMKYLPRDVAFGKTQGHDRGAAIVRKELGDRHLVSQGA